MAFARENAPLTPSGQRVPNRFPQIHGFVGGFLPLATIFLCLRLYARWKFSYIGADDMLALVAYTLFLGLIIATFMAMKYGLGVHILDVDYAATGQQLQKCGFTSQLLYPASQGFVKLSILIFLSRVIPGTSPWKKRIYALAAFVLVQEIAFTFALLLQCRPIAFYWNKDLKGTCIEQPPFYYVDAAINITTDVMIWSLPWIIFTSLRVPRRKKYALLAICSVGVFTLITSIVRLPFLHNLNQNVDPTWDIVDIATWSIAELGSAITTTSIPPIRPLISLFFPKFLRSTEQASDPYTYTGSTTTPSRSRHSHTLISLASIPKGKSSERKNYTEIHAGMDANSARGDAESEDFIVTETGRVVRASVKSISRCERVFEPGVEMGESQTEIQIPPRTFLHK
ncbi:hypothetical protein GQ43DRAFT_437893 [Delitschia confertaspora ATCC 74209]|uniref:Rhodopsin domain-containing protein n=1 Tax=Delitschia confertaspora ATCC 74209 TaxID=1513339 RepID=A0A9P4N257_9PLEO|nr:hypothetical protein GQ43DRAFT_437893 [Delitschia confertaspora ATCC 74209]